MQHRAAPAGDAVECTVPLFARIEVGQTISAVPKGVGLHRPHDAIEMSAGAKTAEILARL